MLVDSCVRELDGIVMSESIAIEDVKRCVDILFIYDGVQIVGRRRVGLLLLYVFTHVSMCVCLYVVCMYV